MLRRPGLSTSVEKVVGALTVPAPDGRSAVGLLAPPDFAEGRASRRCGLPRRSTSVPPSR